MEVGKQTLKRSRPPGPAGFGAILKSLINCSLASSRSKSGGDMRTIDRVSGGFLVILFAGVALLCGSLLFATLG